MSSSKLAAFVTFLALAGGVGVAAAVADDSGPPPPPPTDCSTQAGQQGVNEEQDAADEIADTATEVDQEADDDQADDEAGDQQGPDDESDEEGEADECDDDGDD